MAQSDTRFAVTGAGGFIGSAVVRALLDEGHSPRILLGPADSPPSFEAELDSIRGDILDEGVRQAFVRPESVVIHLAGPPSVAESFGEPAQYVDTHAIGTHELLQLCQRRGIRRFVYVSSAEVYGRPAANPVREDHALRPLSPYAAAKAAAEMLVHGATSSGAFETVILRPFLVYGPGMRETGVVGQVLNQALNEDRILLSDPGVIRDFCFVEDVAFAIRSAALERIDSPVTINVGSGKGMSVLDLARAALKVLDRDVPILKGTVSDRPAQNDIRRMIGDVSTAETVLGWCARTSIDEGLSLTVASALRQCGGAYV